ncbi:MAG TPA: UDP-3-O-(3-hydroxymyristoyl)glucosamine N-acyltransferase [Vicinamibacterales bacterium]|nr:UDP-3-O-(3-hydroxymyristoyl)glucosamine N-acyltransferase [Vicinamibacterales bacterium]
MTLADLARELGCRLDGDGTIDVVRVAGIEDAGPGEVTFLANPKYASKLAATRASAVIADASVTSAPCAILRTPQPYLAFAAAVGLLTPPARLAPGISPLASVDPTAELGAGVTIGPFVTIGPRAAIGARTVVSAHTSIGEGASLGADCLIHTHVSIRENVTIGHRVVVQDAAVIGSDGFGFARRPDGTHQKIPQVGRVIVEDDVEIGAHTAIDRPAVGETRIGAGTKIDNLVQVAHGVKIGRNVLLAAQVGIAGSTSLADDVMMAGQSGATGHIHLGRGAIVGAKSAVTKDVEDGQHVAGIPAGDAAEWRESAVLVRRLPEVRRLLADLEARLAALEAKVK